MRQVAWRCFLILQRNKVSVLAFSCLHFDMLLVRSLNGHPVTSLGCRVFIWSLIWDMVVGPKGNPAKQLRFKNSVFSESQTWSLGRQKITAKLLEFDFFPRPQASKELGFKKIFHLAPTEDKVRNSALFFNFKAPGNKNYLHRSHQCPIAKENARANREYREDSNCHTWCGNLASPWATNSFSMH